MTITMTVNGADRRVSFDWQAAAAAWSKDASRLTVAALKAAAPVSKGVDPRKPKPGKLRDSIMSRTELSTGLATITAYSTVPYAGFVIGGTRPHKIQAKNKPFLAWIDGASGGWMFAREVQHPGTKPNKFPDRALSALQPALASQFAQAVQEATL